jgi:hypothetical protein|tara:strand:- start:2585 stop:3151 length:567 start_codon:yes stop_codon:yes gene_type:complete
MIEKPKTQRYKAGIIFLIPFIVLLASTFSFYIGYSPEGRTNNGSLIDPPLSFSDLKLNEIEAYSGKWTVVHFLSSSCQETCWEALYKSRQVRIRLSRDYLRVSRALLVVSSYELSEEEKKQLSKEHPRMKIHKIDKKNTPIKVLSKENKDSYILFDPLGNGILLYSPGLPGGELLEDLKKVLKNSKIG